MLIHAINKARSKFIYYVECILDKSTHNLTQDFRDYINSPPENK